jgi:hypothetical protein
VWCCAGKTLIARQIGKMLNGKEPKVVNGPEVLNKYVGASEENVRNLFKVRARCWCCLFWTPLRSAAFGTNSSPRVAVAMPSTPVVCSCHAPSMRWDVSCGADLSCRCPAALAGAAAAREQSNRHLRS